MNELNDVAKQSVQSKVNIAIGKSGLTAKKFALCIGLNSGSYISMIRNRDLWKNVGPVIWDKVLAWINSGEEPVKYGEKYGFLKPGFVMNGEDKSHTVIKSKPGLEQKSKVIVSSLKEGETIDPLGSAIIKDIIDKAPKLEPLPPLVRTETEKMFEKYLIENANCYIDCKGRHFYFIPYIYEKAGNGVFIMHHTNEIPKEIGLTIKIRQA